MLIIQFTIMPMKKYIHILLVVILVMSSLSAGITLAKKKTKKPATLIITSETFHTGEKVQPNTPSPQLSWKSKTKVKGIRSYALLIYDKHPEAEKWVYWCMQNIPASKNSLPENYVTIQFEKGGPEKTSPNTYGFVSFGGGPYINYEGPHPGGDGDHPFEILMVSLNTNKTLNFTDQSSGKAGSCGADAFMKAVKGKTLAQGTFNGVFGKPVEE